MKILCMLEDLFFEYVYTFSRSYCCIFNFDSFAEVAGILHVKPT